MPCRAVSSQPTGSGSADRHAPSDLTWSLSLKAVYRTMPAMSIAGLAGRGRRPALPAFAPGRLAVEQEVAPRTTVLAARFDRSSVPHQHRPVAGRAAEVAAVNGRHVGSSSGAEPVENICTFIRGIRLAPLELKTGCPSSYPIRSLPAWVALRPHRCRSSDRSSRLAAAVGKTAFRESSKCGG